MKRRGKWWAALALLLTSAALLALPAVHWPLLGWLRGEAFYQGRPTSYWQREVASLAPARIRFASYDSLPTPEIAAGGRLASGGAALPGPDYWADFMARIGLRRTLEPDEEPGWLLLYGHPPFEVHRPLNEATVPIKKQLLRCDDPFVRCLALRFLKYHEFAEEHLVLFQEALHDPDLDVRLEAAFCLRNHLDAEDEPEGTVSAVKPLQLVPIFVQGLEHHHALVRMQCASALGGIGSAAQPAVPALLAALATARNQDEDRGETAALLVALQSIDPAAADKAASK